MAAIIEIAERNGPSPGIETVSVSNLNMGSTDAPNLDPATYPLTAPGDSYEKWFRLFVSSLGGSAKVDNFRLWLSNVGTGFVVGIVVVASVDAVLTGPPAG